MITDVAGDAAWRSLHRLRGLEPDPARAERVRQRCGSLMRRRRRRTEERLSSGAVIPAPLERALTGFWCVSYLLAVARDVFRLYSDR